MLPTSGSTENVAREVARRLGEECLDGEMGQNTERNIQELLGILGEGPRTAVQQELIATGEFDLLPVDVQEVLQASELRQQGRLHDGELHTSAIVRFAGVAAKGLLTALVEQPWDWWSGGRVGGWRREGNQTHFGLSPCGPLIPLRLEVRLSDSDGLQDWRGTVCRSVIETELAGSLCGRSTFEVLEVQGGCVLRASILGAKVRGVSSWLPPRRILDWYQRAEAGNLSFPLPRASGWRGLANHLLLDAPQESARR